MADGPRLEHQWRPCLAVVRWCYVRVLAAPEHCRSSMQQCLTYHCICPCLLVHDSSSLKHLNVAATGLPAGRHEVPLLRQGAALSTGTLCWRADGGCGAGHCLYVRPHAPAPCARCYAAAVSQACHMHHPGVAHAREVSRLTARALVPKGSVSCAAGLGSHSSRLMQGPVESMMALIA